MPSVYVHHMGKSRGDAQTPSRLAQGPHSRLLATGALPIGVLLAASCSAACDTREAARWPGFSAELTLEIDGSVVSPAAELQTDAGTLEPRGIPPLLGDSEALCGMQPPPQRLLIVWAGQASKGTVREYGETRVPMELRNLVAETLTTTLLLRKDVDGTRSTVLVGQYTVPPMGAVALSVDLSASGAQLSGEAVIQAFVQTDSGDGWTVHSEPAYFHEEGETLLVYDEPALQQIFNYGAFRGLTYKAVPVPLAAGIRHPLMIERVVVHSPIASSSIAAIRSAEEKADREP